MAGNDSYTVLLLHCDGSDGSTALTDSCAGAPPHTFTANGNAQIDAAQSKFGGASALCDGTGDYWLTSDSDDFTLGSDDFTIECWFYRNGGDGAQRGMVGQTNASFAVSTRSFMLYLSTLNTIGGQVSSGSIVYTFTGTTSYTSVGWNHAAFVKTAGTFKLFANGIEESSGSGYSSLVVNDSTDKLGIGCLGDGLFPWNGWLDEIRISKGIARWTSNFTPPTAPYGNSLIYNPRPMQPLLVR